MSGKHTPVLRTSARTPGPDLFEANAAAAWLALAAPVVRGPSPRVKAALLDRVRAAKDADARTAKAATGWRFSSLSEDGGWLKLPFPGVRMREVSVDAARDTALVFVEMTPGAIFPDHDHAAGERGLVLSGDLTMAGRRLVAGDFYEAAAGTRHERIASPSGCTGLLWIGARAWHDWRQKLAAS